jgi:hypothetical protein
MKAAATLGWTDTTMASFPFPSMRTTDGQARTGGCHWQTHTCIRMGPSSAKRQGNKPAPEPNCASGWLVVAAVRVVARWPRHYSLASLNLY